VLLITVGPTGSGKTALAKAASKKVAPKARLRSFLIDDDIENDPVYIKRVRAILKDVGAEALRAPTVEILRRFEEAYWQTRTQYGCVEARKRMTSEIMGNPTATSPDIFHVSGGCDSAFDLRLSRAISMGDNILFETTGLSYPKWLVEATHGRYRVVIAYTTVTFDKLLARNKSRAYDDAVKFLRGLGGAPRLADLGDEFKSKVSKIERGLKELKSHKCWESDTHLKKKSVEHCGKVPIDTLLVYNNSGANIQLIATFTS
jgi:hypothetical protein